ncbi:MAG: holo-ACP synthase [Alphaproteobacteria bacterium]
MIIGHGIDLCKQSRIEASLARFGDRFCARIATAGEQQRANRNLLRRTARYAQLFAAKEACSKALGTGFRQGVFWRDMELIPLPSGKPSLKLHNGALKRLQAITPAGMETGIEISLSDEAGLTQASVIIFMKPS